MFARALRPGQKLLAITGSNGKTTVSALTGELARSAGLATSVIGNIGEPVLDALAEHEDGASRPDVFVVELSSFQLFWAPSLRPEAGVVLNIAEDHLDWHSSLADYAAAKAGVLRGRVAVARAGIDLRGVHVRAH